MLVTAACCSSHRLHMTKIQLTCAFFSSHISTTSAPHNLKLIKFKHKYPWLWFYAFFGRESCHESAFLKTCYDRSHLFVQRWLRYIRIFRHLCNQARRRSPSRWFSRAHCYRLADKCQLFSGICLKSTLHFPFFCWHSRITVELVSSSRLMEKSSSAHVTNISLAFAPRQEILLLSFYFFFLFFV